MFEEERNNGIVSEEQKCHVYGTTVSCSRTNSVMSEEQRCHVRGTTVSSLSVKLLHKTRSRCLLQYQVLGKRGEDRVETGEKMTRKMSQNAHMQDGVARVGLKVA